MTELAVPAEDHPGKAEAKSSTLVLSESERRLEHMAGAYLAAEYRRIMPLANAQAAAGYVSTGIGNSRALAAGNPRLHLGLLRSQLRWLRGLKPGSGELRW